MRKTAILNPGHQHNSELASIFHQMSSCYKYLGASERFRAIAYENAAKTISNLQEDISVFADDIETLDKLHGIGTSIAEKIQEFLRTGKIKTFDKLKRVVPMPLLDLLEVNGFGPSTIKTLHESLKINSREDLINSIQSGKVAGIKGFGAKKIENMLRGLKLYKESQARILLSQALSTGNEALKQFLTIPKVVKASLAGSLRRRKETIGDIDIVAAADAKDQKKIIDAFTHLSSVKRVLASGGTRASILWGLPQTQVDLRVVPEREYGAALLYLTGSKEHNIHLRNLAKERNMKLNEYGLFENETGKMMAGRTEAEIYRSFGMDYIPPELREERGEIEAAISKDLPDLLDVMDIKGDFHMHSSWSDGIESIQSMAAYVKREFRNYEYIVVTDHSPSERQANGMNAAQFREQFKEIDRLNKKLGQSFVKKGVEVDILADGSLDLPDDLLGEFDWVVASVHSSLSRDNTDRLIKACEHPCVHCIGHPSGRLIGKREAYKVNWNKLFQSAFDTGTTLEINGQPLRLDLKDDLVKEAAIRKVKLAIGTDAHALKQFSFIQYGVDVARRGWCRKEDILNTRSWKGIEKVKKGIKS
jgi:DNA polymerase (family X)